MAKASKKSKLDEHSETERKFLKILKEFKNPRPPLRVMDYYIDENGEIENQNRI